MRSGLAAGGGGIRFVYRRVCRWGGQRERALGEKAAVGRRRTAAVWVHRCRVNREGEGLGGAAGAAPELELGWSPEESEELGSQACA